MFGLAEFPVTFRVTDRTIWPWKIPDCGWAGAGSNPAIQRMNNQRARHVGGVAGCISLRGKGTVIFPWKKNRRWE